ncbi:hybrid sensor histidine kinase/response regulator, partial [Caulobacter sp. 17J65-9]|nr:hybrid sensor histidine kinase/response regulator [Caulobacter sp. 17J65-9]
MTRAERTGFKLDPWFAAVVVFFLLAVAGAAYPALRSDPSAPGLLLLVGLAGVALMAVFAFGAADGKTKPEAGPEALVEALEEPAALVTPDGRVLAANAAWRETGADASRLPRGTAAPA